MSSPRRENDTKTQQKMRPKYRRTPLPRVVPAIGLRHFLIFRTYTHLRTTAHCPCRYAAANATAQRTRGGGYVGATTVAAIGVPRRCWEGRAGRMGKCTSELCGYGCCGGECKPRVQAPPRHRLIEPRINRMAPPRAHPLHPRQPRQRRQARPQRPLPRRQPRQRQRARPQRQP